jgi:hypothetical protein
LHLLINKAGIVPVDLGFIDEYQQSLWQAKQQTPVATPGRKNMETSPDRVKLFKRTKYWRKLAGTNRLIYKDGFGVKENQTNF